MQKINRKRLEFACNAFLTAMSRQFFVLNPDAEACPVKSLMDYPEAQRSALMKSIGAALKSTETGSDSDFITWMEQQATK